MVALLEGAHVPAAAAAFPETSCGQGGGGRDGGRRRSRTPPRGGADPCMDWNLRRGKCVLAGSCTSGRGHFCAVCADRGQGQRPHRGMDEHSRDEVFRAFGRSNPKDKGRGKGKGKNKKGKNKDQQSGDAGEKASR